MNYYLSTDIIKLAYNKLIDLDYSNQSILHIFFILKGIGIDSLKYNDVNIIKNKGLEFAQDLGSLFSDYEVQPDKCDFINPFMMKTWGTNPTEKLKKWVDGRIKNNIIGGATTWRKIIIQNVEDKFKFTYDYIDQIKELTIKDNKKIPLLALAIWTSRFTIFPDKISPLALCDYFLKRFNITESEKQAFFSTDFFINSISYSNNLHDAAAIRALIGAPPETKNWTQTITISTNSSQIDLTNAITRGYNMTQKTDISVELLKNILTDYYQLILSGAPGTSKSYLCNKLAESYDKVLHIQFHPQYSYQQFVGGYVVDKSDVTYRQGVMLDIIDDAQKNPKKNYLVVIDEINRANTSQVFGDLIQCLDRNNSVEILCDKKVVSYSIPKNIHIVGTMNTTDKTIGGLDYALKRRFLEVYCNVNAEILLELCSGESDFISLCDFLNKINQKIYSVLHNKELCVGHAMFLNPSFKNNKTNKFEWDFNKLEILFNYKILPLVEEYCYGNQDSVNEIFGIELPKRLTGEAFIEQIREFMHC